MRHTNPRRTQLVTHQHIYQEYLYREEREKIPYANQLGIVSINSIMYIAAAPGKTLLCRLKGYCSLHLQEEVMRYWGISTCRWSSSGGRSGCRGSMGLGGLRESTTSPPYLPLLAAASPASHKWFTHAKLVTVSSRELFFVCVFSSLVNVILHMHSLSIYCDLPHRSQHRIGTFAEHTHYTAMILVSLVSIHTSTYNTKQAPSEGCHGTCTNKTINKTINNSVKKKLVFLES